MRYVKPWCIISYQDDNNCEIYTSSFSLLLSSSSILLLLLLNYICMYLSSPRWAAIRRLVVIHLARGSQQIPVWCRNVYSVLAGIPWWVPPQRLEVSYDSTVGIATSSETWEPREIATFPHLEHAALWLKYCPCGVKQYANHSFMIRWTPRYGWNVILVALSDKPTHITGTRKARNWTGKQAKLAILAYKWYLSKWKHTLYNIS